ncbi:hypothetical protein E4T48_06793 [Aureobasidium sp. EXF-10727]|nr:hypothetical protein E4T48_06793 [Aureobasidium sp. EXF-10727]
MARLRHSTKARRANYVVINVALGINGDNSLFPILGYLVGKISANRISLVTSLEHMAIRRDDLKAFSAAFATTSSTPMFYITGITSKAISPFLEQWKSTTLIVKTTKISLANVWSRLDKAIETKINLISLGNPYFFYKELALLC